MIVSRMKFGNIFPGKVQLIIPKNVDAHISSPFDCVLEKSTATTVTSVLQIISNLLGKQIAADTNRELNILNLKVKRGIKFLKLHAWHLSCVHEKKGTHIQYSVNPTSVKKRADVY